MKTFKLLSLVILSTRMIYGFDCYGQATEDNNLPTFGNYLGFNSTSLIALPIRNDGNQAIEFYTSGNLRMTLATTSETLESTRYRSILPKYV